MAMRICTRAVHKYSLNTCQKLRTRIKRESKSFKGDINSRGVLDSIIVEKLQKEISDFRGR